MDGRIERRTAAVDTLRLNAGVSFLELEHNN